VNKPEYTQLFAMLRTVGRDCIKNLATLTGIEPTTFSDIIFNILEYYYNIIHNQEGTATYVDFYKWYLFVSDLVFILAGY
jgi:hypothetical protein